jgi:hypothetical protein
MRPEAESLFFEGNRLLAKHEVAAAAACFQKACAMEPAFAQSWANLALAQDRLGDPASAEITYRKAIDAGCDAFELHLNYGALLAAQRRMDEAEAAYTRALQLDNTSPAIWSNLGALYLALQQDEDALTCLEKALQLRSDHTSAHVNLAYLHLRNGDFAQGWPAFESRDWYGALASQMPCPRWKGEPLEGKSLVLIEQAGHGDVIQFVRYVPLLKKMGVRHITMVCHPALCALMRTVTGLDAVFSSEAAPTAADYWSPLMSLPYLLQTRADTIPADIPYLQPDSRLVAQWRERLDTDNAAGLRRVGLVWMGNPAFENDAERSIADFKILAPLLAVPGIAFYSLQKGAGETQPALLNAGRAQQGLPPYPVESLGAAMHHFADAAAIVTQLDLIITVDTAMAHLAGALGVPCWVLLPDYMADWRWGVNADATVTASVWYPKGMRLWRQSRGGSWPEVIANVANALQNLITIKP